MIENVLKSLFDFQRFSETPELEELIQDTFDRWGATLSDEELNQVVAAGEPSLPPRQEDPHGSL